MKILGCTLAFRSECNWIMMQGSQCVFEKIAEKKLPSVRNTYGLLKKWKVVLCKKYVRFIK